MAIRIDIQEYCSACRDFEADITKPEVKYYHTGLEFVTKQTDTVIRCKYAKRCENIKRFLEKQAAKEDAE